MKKRWFKATSAFLIITMLLSSGGVYALEDYRTSNRIDYMDEVFRFDLGEFAEGSEKPEVEDPYAWYIGILCDIGVYPEALRTKKGNSQVTYTEIDRILTSLVLKDTSYADAFDADNTERVTMYDALSKMCSVLGYHDVIEELGIESIAGKHKLLSGISYSADRKITFGEFSVLLWNTVNAEGLESDYSDGSISYRETDTAFLEYHLEISKVKGFVNALNGINLYKNEAPEDGFMEIDRAKYYFGDRSVNDYLGHSVVAYTRKNDNDENVILHIENAATDTAISIDFSDIDSVRDGKLSYYGKSGKAGALRSVDLSGIHSVTVNGNANAALSVLNDFQSLDGSVTFSKSGGSNAYDIAVIYTYEYFVIDSVDPYDERIYLKDHAEFGGKPYIEIPEKGYILCMLSGAAIRYTEFAPGNVIRVLQNEKKTYTELLGFSNTVTGEITRYASESGELTINQTTYKVAKSYSRRSDSVPLTVGVYGTFYVSHDRHIAGYKKVADAAYGFLRNVDTDGFRDRECSMQVFTENNEWKTLTLKEKITLDGKDRIDAKDALRYMSANGCTDSLIRYKLGADGQVTFIDTIVDDVNERSDPDRLLKVYEGTVTMSWQGGRWFRSDMGYRILNDRPVFELPSRPDKTEDYKAFASANLNQDEKDTYITLYSADSLGLCQVAVVSQQSDNIATDTTYWFYCESIAEAWSEEDGDFEYEMVGKRLQNGGAGEAVDFSVRVTKDKKESLENITPGAVAPGSLMRITYNSDGYLSGADVKFTDATLPPVYVDKISNYFQHFCGDVQEVDTERGYIKVDCQTETFVMPVICVIVIDKESYKCRKIGLGEIHVGERMFVFRAAGYGRICAIVR